MTPQAYAKARGEACEQIFMDWAYEAGVPAKRVVHKRWDAEMHHLGRESKVQIKSVSGRGECSCSHHGQGNSKTEVYRPEDVDYFFAVRPEASTAWLIPASLITNKRSFVVNKRWNAFKIRIKPPQDFPTKVGPTATAHPLESSLSSPAAAQVAQ